MSGTDLSGGHAAVETHPVVSTTTPCFFTGRVSLVAACCLLCCCLLASRVLGNPYLQGQDPALVRDRAYNRGARRCVECVTAADNVRVLNGIKPQGNSKGP